MTVLLSSAARRSRYLFELNAAHSVHAAEQALDARTGEAATFTRAGIKTALDAAGLLRVVGYGLPSFEWATDPTSGLSTPGLLLDPARTNVVLWNRDLTNAAWTKTSATAAKTQTGIDGVASSASLLTASAGNGTALQAITLASSARYQSAFVKRVTGSGTVQMTTDNGATWTAVTVTSAWTRVTIPTQTLANPTVGFRLVTSGDAIAVDYVQNENATGPSTPIATTTVAVSRVVDALSLAFNGLPQAMTVYAKGVNRGLCNLDATPLPYLWHIGATPDTGRALCYWDGSAFNTYLSNGIATRAGGVTVAPALGDTVEVLSTYTSAGVLQTTASLNGGTATVGSASAALSLPSTWNSAIIQFMIGSVAGGPFSYQTLRVAAGVQTLATMRQG